MKPERRLYPTVAEVEELRKFENEEYKRKHPSTIAICPETRTLKVDGEE